jgi:hypothetical protein
MCMNCGCGRPNDDRGDPANITAADLQRAADANGQTPRESARHILETVELLDGSRRDAGLAEPAGASGGQGGGRGTPASES